MMAWGRTGVRVTAVAVAVVFGAGVQFLGARSGWGARVGGVSAPWLLIPFLAGWTQPRRRDGALLGLAVTLAALSAYFVLMWSPVEGVHLLHTRHAAVIGGHLRFVTVADPASEVLAKILGLVATQALWIGGAAVTGPVFGVLGHEWHTARTWRSGLAIALAFCLEPFAVIVFHDAFQWVPAFGGFGSHFTVDIVAVAEFTLGLVLVGMVSRSTMRWHNTRK